MLISIVLKLVSARNLTLPLHLGRANYAETLACLSRVQPGLGDEVHAWEGMKPLTCSGLMGEIEREQGSARIQAGAIYAVRMTGLTEQVSAALVRGLLTAPPTHWRLGHHQFEVVDAVCDPSREPWSGHDTYQRLAEAHLLTSADGHQRHKVALNFQSPTAFRSKEMQMPLPLPGLVFGNLIDRWNLFSPLTLNAEMRGFAEAVIEVGRFNLHSVLIEQKNKAFRVGAVGDVTYTTAYADRYWLGLFQLLADFALYSGVGVQTSTGMGQVQRLT